MTHKTAYIWGPVTSFNGPLAALLVMKGWHVHFACKSSLNFLSLSPLDLTTQAQTMLDSALGGKDNARTFKDRLKLVEPSEIKNQHYDAIIFSALPPNFDESRSPRAPWTGADFRSIAKTFKGVPTFIISSLWGGVQKDGVVPEELEFARRKPLSQWENTCQQYELRLLESLSETESPWYLVRLPLLTGDTKSGATIKFAGIYSLIKELQQTLTKPIYAGQLSQNHKLDKLKLTYNPDSTLWFLPVDVAVNTFFRILEDESRPRICNLVSTQMTLNREWLNHLGQTLGVEELIAAEPDGLNLSNTMRKLLLDDVQVKTRNLFEVSGRYQLLPVRLDREYLQKLLLYAQEHHWGEPQNPYVEDSGLDYSEKVAHYYFEQFVPEKIRQGALKNAKINGTKIGFKLKASSGQGWLLKSGSGELPEVTHFDPTFDKPDVCFYFSGMTLARLIQKKMHLKKALLMKEVTVEGNMLSVLKVAGTIEKFLQDFPLNPQDLIKSQQESLI
ncbi:MAG: SCP2 sterol-binding domain-containing protein [Candidatus Obscuribacter sp.]|jgi:putative sterol carrier protein|nr:SCP2 sterol-binding domain-containing protein [Candidatus Obscuribacter sp.]MBK9619224.1 SCP2 sterol-binding domain-containing protein [Candidatus Obscuribacter sp.]MBK9769363.1 SCP2 sterol-binding domain-containing protein [Candidatus Obscuribacter sp.]MDQ5967031.1 sterol-binding protein [Cyanobacteriota bacterium erpe_2018_sw_39hr_WHONDRS-SW48-000098_B_bin.30]